MNKIEQLGVLSIRISEICDISLPLSFPVPATQSLTTSNNFQQLIDHTKGTHIETRPATSNH